MQPVIDIYNTPDDKGRYILKGNVTHADRIQVVVTITNRDTLAQIFKEPIVLARLFVDGVLVDQVLENKDSFTLVAGESKSFTLNIQPSILNKIPLHTYDAYLQVNGKCMITVSGSVHNCPTREVFERNPITVGQFRMDKYFHTY